MNNAQQAEQEDNLRLRKAQEFIAHSRELETRARIELARAVEQSKRAKEKYEELFAECEQRACARRKAGLITVNPGY